MRRPPVLLIASALLGLVACAPAASTPVAGPAPDRILVIDANGQPVRRSTADEIARVTFDAPLDRVWLALVRSYADLGIEANVANRAAGQYGSSGFTAPRRIADRPLGDFFACGSGLTGPLVDAGRLTANVLTTLRAAPDGKTEATTYVAGTLRRHEGTSTAPAACSSTGALEERLRRGIERRLAAAP